MTNQFIISNPEVDLEESSPSPRLTTSTVASPEPSSGVNFEWANGIGGSGSDSGLSLAIDSVGNVYTTGGFEGTVDFDPGAGTFNLTSAGFEDIFISKLDSDGNFLWAHNFGGTSFDNGNSLAIDSAGNVYTTGYFSGTIDFDPGAGTFNLTSSPAGSDVFISKLDSDGNFLWAKNFGGTGSDIGNSLAIDSIGNVYITGNFEGTADFDPGAGTFNLTSSVGGPDVFISKLDSQGNFLWAKSFGGFRSDSSKSLAIDSVGNVYTTGYFKGTVDFDPGAGTFNLTSSVGGPDVFNHDIFISKLDSQGNFEWAKRIGGIGFDSGNSLDTDSAGNVYTTGNFGGTADFDPGAGTFNLTSDEGSIFVSKLDSEGNFLWAQNFGGNRFESGNSLATDRAGNVYTTGRFDGTADFDPGAGTFNLTSSFGEPDIFISKLDSQGNFEWAKSIESREKNIGGSSWDAGNSLDTDSVGNVYITGYFQSTADFDPGAGTFNLTSAGFPDIFISKLSGSQDEVNVIEGTPGRDVLTGTNARDRITGFQGRDTLTGGGGADEFVYTRIGDRLDWITDFEVGSDKIVLTEVFDRLNNSGSDLIAERYLRLFAARGDDTIIFIDPDGMGSRPPRPLLLAENVSVTDLNDLGNFVF